MDTKIILLRAIQLVFRDSQLGNNDEESRNIVRETLKDIPPMENSLVSEEREIINRLRDFLIEVLSIAQEGPMDASYVLDTLKLIFVNDENMLCLLEPMFSEKLNTINLKILVTSTRRSLSRHNTEKNLKKVLNDAHYKFNFRRDEITDVAQFIDEHIAGLELFRVNTERKDPGVLSRYKLSDIGEMKVLASKSSERSSVANGLITGVADFNEMIGGYFVRGNSVFLNALPHMNKTGTCAGWFVDFCTLNKPTLKTIQNKKKPCHVWYSLEDEPELALKRFYRRLKYDETREFVPYPSKPIDGEEDYDEKLKIYNSLVEGIADYTHERLSVNGFETFVIRVNPDLWTYRDLMNDILRLEAEGYEVYSCVTDYIMRLNKAGCKGDGTGGSELIDLVVKLRNFFASRNTLWINPHQLSSDALKIVRSSTSDDKFVKEIAGKGFLDGSTRLHHNYDLEIVQHLTVFNGRTYCSMARGKNKEGEHGMAEIKKYIIMPMPDGGMPIPTDINGGPKLTFRKLIDAVRSMSNNQNRDESVNHDDF